MNVSKLAPVIISIVALVIAALSFFHSSGSVSTTGRESVLQRIETNKTIRVGYIPYPPSFTVDPNTNEKGGIFHEALFAICDKLGWKVEYVEEVGWGTMIESVRSGRVDIIATGLWPTTARGLKADFSNALYYSPVRAYVRSDDSRFDASLESINEPGVTIATIDGEMSSIIASSDFPNAARNELSQTTEISQLLLEVITKKADLTFVEPIVAERFGQANPGAIKAVSAVDPIRTFPNVFMVAKGQHDLLSTINTGILELHSTGILKKIVDANAKPAGLLIMPGSPYQSEVDPK